jgi:hypothetical protein
MNRSQIQFLAQNGKRFELVKFRSRRPTNDLGSQTMWCAAAGNCVVSVGSLLRSANHGQVTIGSRPVWTHSVEGRV